MTILNTQHSQKLSDLLKQNKQHLLSGGLKGIEKESLRISEEGRISQTPHPSPLGAALTHSCITTDYSEALLEFITPPFKSITDTLSFMHHIHQYVYSHLDNEMLLSASMPCGIEGDKSVPIAHYGSSNIGTMKHVYRHGLWHRYGRTMQAIAGIHFNYSVPTALWPVLYKQSQCTLDLNDFISESYFDLIRNFQHQGWLILYLFGASPAICKNFFKSRPHLMAEFDELDQHTLFHPYATSLRMSDIGYKSENQANLKINYNSLSEYVDSLGKAIETPYPDYEKIGVKVDGHYRQLNANTLQIENEFYSTMRPKQIAESGEKPTLALKRRGVKYIEMRSLDLDLFNPIGIDADKSRFIEAFLLHCLLQDSPKHQGQESLVNNANQLDVAHKGRQPDLTLNRQGEQVLLKDWANDIILSMQPVCEILDADTPDKPYSRAIEQQLAVVQNPELTPSAKILKGMREDDQPFGCFGLNISRQHKHYFEHNKLDHAMTQQFDEMATASYQKQQAIEASDTLSFDQFLAHYFSQD
jgi:glutamate--cysteine ligase